jgi:hypothetical protein
MNIWLLLILTLPTENATARMRVWRILKSCGATVLRDGVYLLPDRPSCRTTFDGIAAEVLNHGGSAYVLRTDDEAAAQFQQHFNRTNEYAALMEDIHKVSEELNIEMIPALTKRIRKLRKNFMAIVAIDFFPSQAQRQTDAALVDLEVAVNQLLSPNEPHPVAGEIKRLSVADYQGRIWATRSRPWVDRLASAWLIRRFIDKDARFIWLGKPADCPADAVGFDFDDATFTHVGDKVTYEVLLASFGLQDPALQRLGTLVHYLDIGGVQPSESIGVESVLAGLRDTIHDDDQLLAVACGVFDGLLGTYGKIQSK